MDTSETYIKMCGCEEIQNIVIERVKADSGWLRTSRVGLLVNAIAKDGEVFTFHLDTWLPTQSQLQEMVDADWTGELMRRFYNWCRDYGFSTRVNKSMEQLWLAFYMKEQYSKIWDGKQWL